MLTVKVQSNYSSPFYTRVKLFTSVFTNKYSETSLFIITCIGSKPFSEEIRKTLKNASADCSVLFTQNRVLHVISYAKSTSAPRKTADHAQNE